MMRYAASLDAHVCSIYYDSVSLVKVVCGGTIMLLVMGGCTYACCISNKLWFGQLHDDVRGTLAFRCLQHISTA
jgi:hypothetical protein